MKNIHQYGVLFLLVAIGLMLPASSGAISLDKALDTAGKVLSPETTGSTGSSMTSSLTDSEIIAGLKEALSKAVDNSITFLGKPNGYLDNADVRIPLPDHLAKAHQMASAVGQGELADAFVASMNNAAEQAVPETVEIFTKAIKQMSFADAKGILEGPNDAATSYFQRTSTTDLAERIRPIVSKAMETVGVTQKYKDLTSGVTSVGAMLDQNWFDLDGYVTNKAIDGLFVIMAQEEGKIRENPVARTTDLLKKVFGSVN